MLIVDGAAMKQQFVLCASEAESLGKNCLKALFVRQKAYTVLVFTVNVVTFNTKNVIVTYS